MEEAYATSTTHNTHLHSSTTNHHYFNIIITHRIIYTSFITSLHILYTLPTHTHTLPHTHHHITHSTSSHLITLLHHYIRHHLYIIITIHIIIINHQHYTTSYTLHIIHTTLHTYYIHITSYNTHHHQHQPLTTTPKWRQGGMAAAANGWNMTVMIAHGDAIAAERYDAVDDMI